MKLKEDVGQAYKPADQAGNEGDFDDGTTHKRDYDAKRGEKAQVILKLHHIMKFYWSAAILLGLQACGPGGKRRRL